MHSTNEKIKASIANDNGQNIYLHYGFIPSRSKAQKENPFRNEKTSSFFIYPKGNFYDYGDTEIKGDAISFIQLYENCDFKRAIQIAGQIYGLDTLEDYKPTKPTKKGNTKQIKEDIRGVLESISFRSFSQSELKYWQDKTGIGSAKELTALGVQSVQRFSIRYGQKIASYENQQFCFAFEIVPNKSYKLYQPKEHLRGYGKSAKTAYLPNLDSAKAQAKDFEYSIGIETLDSAKTAFLVGGESDYLAMKSNGLNAFTLGSEKGTLSPYTLARLEAKGIENISICFDTDYTGIQSAKKLSKDCGFGVVTLPKLEKQTDKNKAKPAKNDICDYLGLFGFDSELEKALAVPTYHKPTKPLKQATKAKESEGTGTAQNIHIEKYLGEKIGELKKIIKGNKEFAINANTGTGKTDVFYNLANANAKAKNKLFGKLIMVFPTNAILEAKSKEYSEKANNFHGLKFSILDINQNTETEIKAKIDIAFQAHDIIHITRNSFYKVANWIEKNDLIVCDEAHKIPSDSYCELGEFWELLSNTDAKKAHITGTPIKEFYDIFGVKQYNFIEKNPIKNNFNFYEITKNEKKSFNPSQSFDLKTQAIFDYIETLDTSKNLVYPVFFNAKKKIDFIAKEIEKQGVFDVVKIYSNEDIKQSEAYKSIIEKQLVPCGKKPVILLATSYIYEGISIQNNNISEIAFFGESNKENILQGVARFRKLKQRNINIFLPIQTQKTETKRLSFNAFQDWHFGEYCKVLSNIKSNFQAVKPSKDGNPLEEIQTKFVLNFASFITKDLGYNKFNLVGSFLSQKLSNFQLFESLEDCEKAWFGVVNISDSNTKEIEENKEAIKEEKEEIQSEAFKLIKANFALVCVYLLNQKKIPSQLKTKLREKYNQDATKEKHNPTEQYLNLKEGIKGELHKELISIVSKCVYLENFFVIDSKMFKLIESNYTKHKFSRLCEKLTIINRNNGLSKFSENHALKINKLFFDNLQGLGKDLQGLKLTRFEIIEVLKSVYGKNAKASDSQLFSIFTDMFELKKVRHRSKEDLKRCPFFLKDIYTISLEKKRTPNLKVKCYQIESFKTLETFATKHGLQLIGNDFERKTRNTASQTRGFESDLQALSIEKTIEKPSKEIVFEFEETGGYPNFWDA